MSTYSYRFANLKISSAKVFENLVKNISQADLGSDCSHPQMGAICSQADLG